MTCARSVGVRVGRWTGAADTADPAPTVGAAGAGPVLGGVPGPGPAAPGPGPAGPGAASTVTRRTCVRGSAARSVRNAPRDAVRGLTIWPGLGTLSRSGTRTS